MVCWILALVLPLLVSSAPVFVKVLPQDCDEIYRNGTRLSGVYTIYPERDTPVEVYCEMHSNDGQSGGWTVFQRRMDGSVSFYRPWDPYRNGFGNESGEYWLGRNDNLGRNFFTIPTFYDNIQHIFSSAGLENLYLLTHKKNFQLRVDLEDFDGMKVYALYTSFSVDSEATGYMLHVGGFVDGGAGDALSGHNGMKFSTYNRDQDAVSANCARSHLGGFWYSNCHQTNPNGIYLGGLDGTLYTIGNVWQPWRGYDYGLKYICMRIRLVP